MVFLVSLIPLVYSQAPFTLQVEPETATASPGDLLDYTITINANQGFEDDVIIELEITALSYNEYYMIGEASPPYPAKYDYTFVVPEEIPGDVTAKGVIKASSGEHIVEKEVTLTIKSGGILGSIIGWILSILNAIRNFFS